MNVGSNLVCTIACVDKILICGGEGADVTFLNTTEWFDGCVISDGPTMLNDHYGPSCAFINGKNHCLFIVHYRLKRLF